MINQNVLNLHVFCNKTKGHGASNILVDGKQSVALDGDIMGIISNPETLDTEYPSCEGKEFAEKAFISANTAKNFKMLKSKSKHMNEKLNNVVLLKNENIIALYNTNLEGAVRTEEPQHDQSFPNYKDIIPKTHPLLSVKFDIHLLKKMIDYLNKFDQSNFATVTLGIYGINDAMSVDCTNQDGQKFFGLIMPIEQKYVDKDTEEAIAALTKARDKEDESEGT